MIFAKVSIYSVEEIRDKTILPALVDEEKVIQGSEAILAHLDLRNFGISSKAMLVPVMKKLLIKSNTTLHSKADRGGDEESTSRSMTRRHQRYAHEGDWV